MGWDASDGRLSLILGSLSIFFCIPILLSTALFPICRSQSRMLVFYLTLTNFSQGIYYSIQNLSEFNSDLCLAESIFALFVDNSSFFWTLSITIYIWRGLNTSDDSMDSSSLITAESLLLEETNKLIRFFHLFSWGIPFIISLMIFIYNHSIIEYTNPWCLINPSHSIFMYFAIYIPLLFSYLFILIFYFLAQRNLKNLIETQSTLPVHSDSMIQWELTDIRSKLLYIPLLFLITRSFDLIYRILSIFDKKASNSYWLSISTAIFNPSQGIYLGLIFIFFTRKIRILFIYWFQYCDRNISIQHLNKIYYNRNNHYGKYDNNNNSNNNNSNNDKLYDHSNNSNNNNTNINNNNLNNNNNNRKKKNKKNTTTTNNKGINNNNNTNNSNNNNNNNNNSNNTDYNDESFQNLSIDSYESIMKNNLIKSDEYNNNNNTNNNNNNNNINTINSPNNNSDNNSSTIDFLPHHQSLLYDSLLDSNVSSPSLSRRLSPVPVYINRGGSNGNGNDSESQSSQPATGTSTTGRTSLMGRIRANSAIKSNSNSNINYDLLNQNNKVISPSQFNNNNNTISSSSNSSNRKSNGPLSPNKK